jgi:predicted phage tail component-like protein
MYSFTDTNEKSIVSSTSSESFTINGKYLEDQVDGFRVLYTIGREFISASVSETETERVNGARYLRKRYSPRDIIVGYQLLADSPKAMRLAYNRLASALDAEEAVFIFNDEDDKFYVGTVTDKDGVQPGRLNVTSEFTIHCSDPFKYSNNEYSFGGSSADSYSVSYDGTYISYPVITITVASATGWIGLANSNGAYIQVGSSYNDKSANAKFAKGDVITIDISEASIKVAGSTWVSTDPQPQLGNIGNTWEDFYLSPGANTIKLTYSSYATRPAVKISYRRVYV